MPEPAQEQNLYERLLDLFFSHASNGATFTDVDRQHLYRIKHQQADPDTLDEEAPAASTHPGNQTAREFTAAMGHDPTRFRILAARSRALLSSATVVRSGLGGETS